MPIAAVVDLVNGWGTVPRLEAGEQDQELPSFAELAGRFGVLATLAGGATAAELQRVADLVYPVFAASTAAQRASLVDSLLTEAGVRPGLRATGDGLEAGWVVDDSAQSILAAAAGTLYAQLTEHAPERLGTCTGRRCADAYVDASPGGHRRYCSVTCQNRARVATFRRRHSTSTRTGS
jgi:predicted RNA-binding Zn ribbon-like protein